MDFWSFIIEIAILLVYIEIVILLLFKLKPANESLQDGGQALSIAQRRELAETEVENVALEILKEIEILSDTKGRHILHLAKMYVPSVLARPRASKIRWD